jgi:hypothetical protein
VCHWSIPAFAILPTCHLYASCIYVCHLPFFFNALSSGVYPTCCLHYLLVFYYPVSTLHVIPAVSVRAFTRVYSTRCPRRLLACLYPVSTLHFVPCRLLTCLYPCLFHTLSPPSPDVPLSVSILHVVPAISRRAFIQCLRYTLSLPNLLLSGVLSTRYPNCLLTSLYLYLIYTSSPPSPDVPLPMSTLHVIPVISGHASIRCPPYTLFLPSPEES